VAVFTNSRHAERSRARRFAVPKPRFRGRRSFSIVLIARIVWAASNCFAPPLKIHCSKNCRYVPGPVCCSLYSMSSSCLALVFQVALFMLSFRLHGEMPAVNVHDQLIFIRTVFRFRSGSDLVQIGDPYSYP